MVFEDRLQAARCELSLVSGGGEFWTAVSRKWEVDVSGLKRAREGRDARSTRGMATAKEEGRPRTVGKTVGISDFFFRCAGVELDKWGHPLSGTYTVSPHRR